MASLPASFSPFHHDQCSGVSILQARTEISMRTLDLRAESPDLRHFDTQLLDPHMPSTGLVRGHMPAARYGDKLRSTAPDSCPDGT
ncbi:hypothetical protein Landi51_02848 [Colletotrichum acutatum]